MTPQEFTFKLTVPNDPEGATLAAVVATHAVEYAQMEKAAGEAFVQKVRITVAQALKDAGGHASLIIVTAASGQLMVTIAGQSVSAPLPS